jgi:hypothetical protein
MTPRDLLARLEAEGVTAELKLRLEGTQPSPETLELVKLYRDDLITHLALEHGDTPQMCRLSEQLTTGAVWCKRCYRYQMRPCVASGKRFKDVN